MTAPTSSSGSVQVHSYTLNRWDLLQAQLHGLSRNRVLMFFSVASSLFAASITLQSPGLIAHTLFVKGCVFAFFALLMSIFIAAVTTVVLWVMILVGKHRGVLGAHSLEITPTGLIERTDFNETVFRWQGIQDVIRTRKYLYLWITDFMVFSVPLRSFESLEAARVFQSEVEKHWADANESKAVPTT